MRALTDVSGLGLLSSQNTARGLSHTEVNSAILRQSLIAVRSALRDGGIAEWQVEAEVLLRHVLGLDRSEFLALLYGSDLCLTDSQFLQLRSLLAHRLSGEPLAYIVGYREFYGLELEVDSRVLVPRQETELLVDLALEHLAGSSSPRPLLADVGTGSGAVALAVAAHIENVNVTATDISTGALEVARRNAITLGLSDRLWFVHGDMLSSIEGPIDVIVSNPPYIPSDEIEGLAVEVRQEPRIALDGGIDGLDPLRRLFAQTSGKLATGGALIVELMPEQMERAKGLAIEAMGRDIEVTAHKDLMGNDRALVVRPMQHGVRAVYDENWNER